jgi:hypothetical protein
MISYRLCNGYNYTNFIRFCRGLCMAQNAGIARVPATPVALTAPRKKWRLMTKIVTSSAPECTLTTKRAAHRLLFPLKIRRFH